jgi:hypothetical protein
MYGCSLFFVSAGYIYDKKEEEAALQWQEDEHLCAADEVS